MKIDSLPTRLLSHEDTPSVCFQGHADATNDTGNPANAVFLLDPPVSPLQFFSEPDNPILAYRGFACALAIEMASTVAVLAGAGVFCLLMRVVLGA